MQRTFLGAAILAAALVCQAQTVHDALLAAREDRCGTSAALAVFRGLAEAHGTPLYVYDQSLLEAQAKALKAAFPPRFPGCRLLYAMKANTNPTLVALLRGEGLGAEVISEGEMAIALKAGFTGPELLFTSSSKSPSELRRAVALDAVINVDSVDELVQVDAEARAQGRKARISFRINPGVDPHTIHQINTGITESKFGLHLEGGHAFAAYAKAMNLPGVEILGAHCHIGSQIAETEGYLLAARKMLAFAGELKTRLGLRLHFMDLGGGIAVPYQDGQRVMTPEDLAASLAPVWREGVEALGYAPTLWLEPGRFLVAPSGFIVTTVNSVKTTPVKTFVNVDAGFNTLLRPALYQAYHRIRAVGRTGAPRTVDVAGAVCETVDILGEARSLPPVEAGDLLVILDAGAYGFSMASQYNTRPLPAEVLVDGNRATVIRGRGTLEALTQDEAPLLQVHQGADGAWTLAWAGRIYPCQVGRNGLAAPGAKREGDGRTPSGIYPLRRVLYRPDRVRPEDLKGPLPRMPLTPEDGWCDDPASPDYNHPVRLPFAPSHEDLWRKDAAYDLVVPLGYNDDPVVKGLGSAVFLHVAGEGPTSGCVAVSREALLEILATLKPGAALVIR